MEALLRVKEAARRAGLHAQESVQEAGGVSAFSPGATLWYFKKKPTLLCCSAAISRLSDHSSVCVSTERFLCCAFQGGLTRR